MATLVPQLADCCRVLDSKCSSLWEKCAHLVGTYRVHCSLLYMDVMVCMYNE